MAEAILPGTYITVRDEGLISAGSVASGNIGIVGTASKGPVNQPQMIASFSEAKELFGDSDPWQGGDHNELTLIRALELIYNNGGQTVYAVRTAAADHLKTAFYELKDGNTLLLRLEAKGSPGSWGNSIRIKVSDAPSPTTEVSRKQIELTYHSIQETYFVEAGKIGELQTTLNTRSALVTASALGTNLGTRVPTNSSSDAGDFLAQGADGAAAGKDEYQASLALLENDLINLVLLAGQDDSVPWAKEVLEGHLKLTAGIKRERMGVIGSSFTNGKDSLDQIASHSFNSDRLIYTAPGIQVSGRNKTDILPGGYLAAAITGLIASLPVQASPTNKVLSLAGLSTLFNASQLEKLVQNRVLAVEKREGIRVVKGVTTHDGAWRQITTRRIVDSAIYGVRSACNPYIGKLNNERVRGAMKATLDALLTRMVNDEALVGYSLSVTATRDQEKAGEAIVTMTLQPTFSIDFIKVTMYLG